VGEGAGASEERGVGSSGVWEKNDSSHLQTEEEVYAACDSRRQSEPATGATMLSVRSSHVLLGNGKWLSHLLATGKGSSMVASLTTRRSALVSLQ
jgi:hypothetical protein